MEQYEDNQYLNTTDFTNNSSSNSETSSNYHSSNNDFSNYSSSIPDNTVNSGVAQNLGLFSSFALLGGFNNFNQHHNRHHHSTNEIHKLKTQLDEHGHESKELRGENDELYGEIARLRNEVKRLKSLLQQPLQEIAKQDSVFAQNYLAEKEVLATWMITQRAFKELAIQFGLQKGFSPQQINQMGLSMRDDVLNNKNNPNHGTNSTEDFFKQHKEKLLTKFKPKDKQNFIDTLNELRKISHDSQNGKLKNNF